MESDGEFIMAVKYLSGNRLWGTNAERLAMSGVDTSATPTYSGDFGTWTTDSTCTDTCTGGSVSESSDIVTLDIQTRLNNQSTSADLGSTLSNSEWAMRCKLIFTTLTNGGASTIFLELGVGSANASTGFSNNGITQDFIGLQMRTVATNYGWGLVGYKNGNPYLDNPELDADGGSTQKFATAQVVGTYYVEIKRTSTTSMTIGLYDSADFGVDDLIDPILTRTINSGVDELQYLRAGNAGLISESGTGNVIQGTIRDFEIWDQTFPSLPNGTIFITSDTNVHYMWNGTDTWNLVA